jgi:hypothetical protein
MRWALRPDKMACHSTSFGVGLDTPVETTAIYANAIGEEERNLARRAWCSLEFIISDQGNIGIE